MTKDDWDNVGLMFSLLVNVCIFAVLLGLLVGTIKGFLDD
jgi:hypothetical protein